VEARERDVRRVAAAVGGDPEARRQRVDALAQALELPAAFDPHPQVLRLAARREEADAAELELLEALERGLEVAQPSPVHLAEIAKGEVELILLHPIGAGHAGSDEHQLLAHRRR
jgi:hypothetical protein